MSEAKKKKKEKRYTMLTLIKHWGGYMNIRQSRLLAEKKEGPFTMIKESFVKRA